MNRLVVFTDPRDLAARILLPELCKALAARSDMECVALLVTEAQAGWRQKIRWWRDRAARRLQVALGSGRWEQGMEILPLDVRRLAARHGIPVRQMPDGDPNHPDVLRYLACDLKANLAINVYCRRVFRRELLDGFDMTVNYHNGSLPGFRGLRASNWSLYLGHPTSGYSFHRMDAGLDTGNILSAGEVPVAVGDAAADIEVRKAVEASHSLPDLLAAIARREVGHHQVGIACSHDRTAWQLATLVAEPSSLSHEEWRRRMTAFLRITTWLEGDWWPVTGIAPGRKSGCLTFRSADGEWLSVTGLDFWPAQWTRWKRAWQG